MSRLSKPVSVCIRAAKRTRPRYVQLDKVSGWGGDTSLHVMCWGLAMDDITSESFN